MRGVMAASSRVASASDWAIRRRTWWVSAGEPVLVRISMVFGGTRWFWIRAVRVACLWRDGMVRV